LHKCKTKACNDCGMHVKVKEKEAHKCLFEIWKEIKRINDENQELKI
jgi:hypothetical protein